MIHALLMVMTLLSATFSPGATAPPSMIADDCGGANKTPELHWSGVPNGTTSFALVLHDPDAPAPGGFYHWVVYNVPGTARSIAAGADLGAAEHGTNSTGSADYYGPCPPAGKLHHYVFTLYALDLQKIGDTQPLNATDLESRIKGHVLAKATLTATYGR